jgi:hypothetical protein
MVAKQMPAGTVNDAGPGVANDEVTGAASAGFDTIAHDDSVSAVAPTTMRRDRRLAGHDLLRDMVPSPFWSAPRALHARPPASQVCQARRAGAGMPTARWSSDRRVYEAPQRV